MAGQIYLSTSFWYSKQKKINHFIFSIVGIFRQNLWKKINVCAGVMSWCRHQIPFSNKWRQFFKTFSLQEKTMQSQVYCLTSLCSFMMNVWSILFADLADTLLPYFFCRVKQLPMEWLEFLSRIIVINACLITYSYEIGVHFSLSYQFFPLSQWWAIWYQFGTILQTLIVHLGPQSESPA